MHRQERTNYLIISVCQQEITGGRGVDVAVEALGKPLTFAQCTQSVRDGGKAVMIGLTQSGALGEIDINRLVRRQVCIIFLPIDIFFLRILMDYCLLFKEPLGEN